jgi:prepilin-type N-terminal cleavage/methylation domain-containing protein
MREAVKKFNISPAATRRRFGGRPAFTLVEVIVVLFIVSMGLVGILSLIVQNIQSQSYDTNNLIANHLAQEGIELVRKVRDSNWRASQTFNTNLATAVGQTYQYYMDYRDATPQIHSAAPDLVLKQDTNGFYLDANRTGTSTVFSRLITAQLLDAKSLQVTCTVSWSDHKHSFSYVLQTLLYDWY